MFIISSRVGTRLGTLLLLCSFATAGAAQQQTTTREPSLAAPERTLVLATTRSLGNPRPTTPRDLRTRLQKGGLVIVHRYTGSGGPRQSGDAVPGTIDDDQRISQRSRTLMAQLGAKYRELRIPVAEALSSEYLFVYQHATEALDPSVRLSRDLTGSLNFTDPQELEKSLQNLRKRTVTPPPAGTNTVLFTHQGKFDKAWGIYPDAGWTLVFAPDGSGESQLIASLPLTEFLAL